jgi:hypothetical protein
MFNIESHSVFKVNVKTQIEHIEETQVVKFSGISSKDEDLEQLTMNLVWDGYNTTFPYHSEGRTVSWML